MCGLVSDLRLKCQTDRRLPYNPCGHPGGLKSDSDPVWTECCNWMWNVGGRPRMGILICRICHSRDSYMCVCLCELAM